LYFISGIIIFQGISSSTKFLNKTSEEAPVTSPLVPLSLGSSKGVTKAEKVQAILKKIKQVLRYPVSSWS
jgi:hypothetical protein